MEQVKSGSVLAFLTLEKKKSISQGEGEGVVAVGLN